MRSHRLHQLPTWMAGAWISPVSSEEELHSGIATGDCISPLNLGHPPTVQGKHSLLLEVIESQCAPGKTDVKIGKYFHARW